VSIERKCPSTTRDTSSAPGCLPVSVKMFPAERRPVRLPAITEGSRDLSSARRHWLSRAVGLGHVNSHKPAFADMQHRHPGPACGRGGCLQVSVLTDLRLRECSRRPALVAGCLEGPGRALSRVCQRRCPLAGRGRDPRLCIVEGASGCRAVTDVICRWCRPAKVRTPVPGISAGRATHPVIVPLIQSSNISRATIAVAAV